MLIHELAKQIVQHSEELLCFISVFSGLPGKGLKKDNRKAERKNDSAEFLWHQCRGSDVLSAERE